VADVADERARACFDYVNGWAANWPGVRDRAIKEWKIDSDLDLFTRTINAMNFEAMKQNAR